MHYRIQISLVLDTDISTTEYNDCTKGCTYLHYRIQLFALEDTTICTTGYKYLHYKIKMSSLLHTNLFTTEEDECIIGYKYLLTACKDCTTWYKYFLLLDTNIFTTWWDNFTTGYKYLHYRKQISSIPDKIICTTGCNGCTAGYKYTHCRIQISSQISQLQDVMTALDNGCLGPQNWPRPPAPRFI